MSSATGWYRDPYGRHGHRWFSEGQPTSLVRDGEVESRDPPPDGPTFAAPEEIIEPTVPLSEAFVVGDGLPPARWVRGVAVGSVVCGALGIWLLAVPLGLVARHWAGWSTTDRRLGLIGVLLGILSLIATPFIISYASHEASQRATHHAALGQVITLQPQASQVVGLRTVGVYSLRYPVTPSDPRAGTFPVPGYEWAVADVGVCAGPSGDPFPSDPTRFSVTFTDAAAATGQIADSIQAPGFRSAGYLAPGQCARGYVPFAISASARPRAIRYAPLGGLDVYQWDLAR